MIRHFRLMCLNQIRTRRTHAKKDAAEPATKQEVGLALGAQAGEARLKKVAKESGFKRFRRAAKTPLNMVLKARL